MEHEEALKTMAAERYLLQEMSDEERNAFEEHYFDCPDCAADIRNGVMLREVFRQAEATKPEPVVVPFREPRPSRVWWQTAAASIVSLTLGWWGAVITMAPRVPAVQMADAVLEIETGQQRSPEGNAPYAFRENEQAQFKFYVPDAEEAASYVVSIQDSRGKVRWTMPLTRKRAQDPVEPLVGPLPAGKYRLVIEGVRKEGNRFPVTEVPFDVVGENKGST